MKKSVKILIAVAVVVVVIQFFPPTKNTAAGPSAANISAVYTVPADVKTILDKACNDCHSNNTIYPWYTNIQPVGWWMQHHVNEGKEEFNFDAFAEYSPRRQHHKLEELEEMVGKADMPLPSYTWIHKNAILTEGEKQTILSWSKGIRAEMEAKYPADSLKLPPRRKS
ncbi:MAG: heme-binding domain-containing protein [Chitinophagales bacterium]